MSHQRRFLVVLAVLACVAGILWISAGSRFAPRCIRQPRENACADARTIIAAVRYLLTPEPPDYRYDPKEGETLATNPPQAALPARRAIGATNGAGLVVSNQLTGIPSAPMVRG